MASRKVYFYKVSLYDEKENEIKYEELKPLLIDIINQEGYKNGEYYSLDVSPLTEYLHYVLDVFDYKKDRLFCRLSKQKPNNSIIQREYATFKKRDVLPSGTEKDNGIELYTFGILEYKTGIFSIVSSQGAPGIKALENIFEIYRNSYRMELVPIPNTNAIDSIYFGNDPEVSQIEIEVPLPNAETLEHIFGWREDKYLETLCCRNLKLDVTIKGEPRSAIIHGNSESRNIIEKIRENLPRYRKAKLKGKVRNDKLRDYNFFDDNFSYPIDISDYYMRDYSRVYYTVEELVDLYRKNLINAYWENENILRTISNR